MVTAAGGGADDEDLAELQEQLGEWTSRLVGQPVAEVLAAIWGETGVIARLLGNYDGDRNVTDLDHLAEFLHDNSPQGMSGVAGLLALLDHPPDSEADLEVDGDVIARRVESEEQAVQIMTVWKAKGLQFPVVCLPMLWRPGKPAEDVVYTDPVTRRRTMDLAKGKNWPDETDRGGAEEAGPDRGGLRAVAAALRGTHPGAAPHRALVGQQFGDRITEALSRFLFARDRTTGEIDPVQFAAASC